MENETTTTTQAIEIQEEPKSLNDIYNQNIEITYLLMGIVAILIISIIIRRK